MKLQGYTSLVGTVVLPLLSGIPTARADDFRCTAAVGASTVDDLMVLDGASCQLKGPVCRAILK